jgi:subtilisin family serine protease
MGSTPKPQILTNSWGYDVDRPGQSLPNWLKPLEAAVANAVASGVVVCFAAGNGHFAFPGSHPEVISVGGVHVNYPALSLEASSYASSFASSFYPGRKVPDICGLTGKRVVIGGDGKAPSLMLPVQAGANLDGIAPSTGSSSDGWGLFSGTSAACPQVAGVCALMLEKDPTLTPAALKQKLIDGARDVTQGQTAMGDTAVAGNDLATGAGLVDAKWAYLRTMGDVAATFLTAPREDQLAMVQSGSMPEVPKEFIEDLMETLRSR